MRQRETITIDVGTLYSDTAKLAELESYFQRAIDLAGDGNDVILNRLRPRVALPQDSPRLAW